MKPESPSAPEASIVQHCLTGLVDQVCRFPRLVLAAALLLCAVSVYAAYTRLEYRTQRTDLINPHKDYQERWRQYLEEFGDDDDIVVVVKGQDKARMRSALDALAEQVSKQPEHFDRLFYKVDLRPLSSRALLFLSAEQIGQIQDNLQSMGMLLEPPLVGNFDPLIGWKSLTLERLLHEARDRAGKIQ